MTSASYRRLAAALAFPHSATLEWLLEAMLTEDEAAWAAALPATPGQLAEQRGCTAEFAREMLETLVDRGVAYPGEHTPTGTRYHLPAVAVLADSVLIDPQYEHLGAPFYDAWSAFFNEDLVAASEAAAREAGGASAPEAAPVPGFRVVPAEAVVPGEGVADYDRVSWIIGQAELVAVTNCPCRRRERRCDHELEVCLWLDDVARFAVRRGAARPIEKAEALAILERCSAAGLVHHTENREIPRVMCNCCSCCCAFLRPFTAHGLDLPVAPSRYHSSLDATLCTDCGLCLDRCYFGALSRAGDGVRIDAARCVGCGLCAVACPEGALSLVPAADAVPLGHEKWFSPLQMVPDDALGPFAG